MASPIFDPGLPADGSLVDAGELRGQFVSLENSIEDLDGEMEMQAQRGAGVQLLSVTIAAPPTQAQVQAVVDKLNELIASMNS
jgi:hypothetical protein